MPNAPSDVDPASSIDAVDAPDSAVPSAMQATPAAVRPVNELGGPTGPEPTRFGDWERKGRCIDF